MKLGSSEILEVQHVQSEELDGAPRTFTGVSIDSRNVVAGNLFLAIRGERLDGHNFLSNAIKAGAKAIIVEEKWASMNPSFLKALPVAKLVVKDSTKALGELARNHRRRFRIPVLAIAGSNGKTTTKEMIRTVLGQKFEVLATEGNLNNQIGVPLTLLRLESRHNVAVVEIGTNHPGEIKYLCSVLEPTHGLITNIGREHLEFFRSLDGVAKAELELFEWLKTYRPGGIVFLNRDDAALSKKARSYRNAVTFGFSRKELDVRGAELHIGKNATAGFMVQTKKGRIDVSLSVPGVHNAHNALAAVAVAVSLNVPAAKIQRGLESFAPASKRMESFRIDGFTVLNDTYNSNPDSVRAALETLQAMNATGKKIAVLADMLELGKASEQEHRAVAALVKAAGVDYLLTYGPLSKATHDASTVHYKIHYEQKNILSEYLAELLAAGDIVLIKGSRGMKMEDVVTFLKELFSKAA